MKYERDLVYLPNGGWVGFYSPVTEVSELDEQTYHVTTKLGEYHLCNINEPKKMHVKDIEGKSIFDLINEHFRSVGENELADNIRKKIKE